MRKIQYDVINGIVEVRDFDADADFQGTFSDHFANDRSWSRGWFREDFEGVRSMEIGDKLFESLDTEYGIKKI